MASTLGVTTDLPSQQCREASAHSLAHIHCQGHSELSGAPRNLVGSFQVMGSMLFLRIIGVKEVHEMQSMSRDEDYGQEPVYPSRIIH